MGRTGRIGYDYAQLGVWVFYGIDDPDDDDADEGLLRRTTDRGAMLRYRVRQYAVGLGGFAR